MIMETSQALCLFPIFFAPLGKLNEQQLLC